MLSCCIISDVLFASFDANHSCVCASFSRPNSIARVDVGAASFRREYLACSRYRNKRAASPAVRCWERLSSTRELSLSYIFFISSLCYLFFPYILFLLSPATVFHPSLRGQLQSPYYSFPSLFSKTYHHHHHQRQFTKQSRDCGSFISCPDCAHVFHVILVRQLSAYLASWCSTNS